MPPTVSGLPSVGSDKTNTELYYYFISGNQSDTNAIYFAPYPSGFASGLIDYNQYSFIGYENAFGAFPSLDVNNPNTATANTYISNALTGVKKRGVVEIDLYPGGLTGWLNNIHYPALSSYITGVAFVNTYSTYSGQLDIDYETVIPYWFYSSSGSTSQEQIWRNHYSGKYGPTTETNYRNSFMRLIKPFLIQSVLKVRELMPNAKIDIYNTPKNWFYPLTVPNIFSLSLADVKQFNDDNNDLYQLLDQFSLEMYPAIGRAVPNNQVLGAGEIPNSTMSLYYRNVLQEIRRCAANAGGKKIFGWIAPIFSPGVSSLAGLGVDENTTDLIVNLCRQEGCSGLYVWVATPATMGFSSIPAINSGMVSINKKLRYISQSATGMFLPTKNYSPFWDSPLV